MGTTWNTFESPCRPKDIPGPVASRGDEKGAGYAPAEEGSATKWHAPGLFNKETGEILKGGDGTPKPQIPGRVGTVSSSSQRPTAASSRSPRHAFRLRQKFAMEEMPDRAFDVGIAEQHAVTFGAGMATRGLVPFCNICQLHAAGVRPSNPRRRPPKPHVVFCLDRGGLRARTGQHHGVRDLATAMYTQPYRSAHGRAGIAEPHVHVVAEIRWSVRDPLPPRTGSMVDWQTPFEEIEIGRGRRPATATTCPIKHRRYRHRGGRRRGRAEQAWHFARDMRFVKPLDEVMLHEVFSRFKDVITIEDGSVQGGMGSAVTEWAMEHGYGMKAHGSGCLMATSNTAPAQLYKSGVTPTPLWLGGLDVRSPRRASRRACELPEFRLWTALPVT